LTNDVERWKYFKTTEYLVGGKRGAEGGAEESGRIVEGEVGEEGTLSEK